MIEFLIAGTIATVVSCLCTWAVSRWLDKRRAGRKHTTPYKEEQ